MRDSLFVDTGYVIALVNQHDRYHSMALGLSDKFNASPLVISDAVLMEIGNALSRIARKEAVEIIAAFKNSENVVLVHDTPDLFDAAVRMYQSYQDKTWGLVDCLSFVIMRKLRINRVLGFDRHFVQAGFQLATLETLSTEN